MRHPLKIHHIFYRPANAADIVTMAAYNLSISGQERSLLSFYASCGEGFAPAIEVGARETGIRENKIWQVRDKLAQKRLVLISDGTLSIDWFRLAAYAGMDKQTKHAVKSATYGSEHAFTIGQMEDSRPDDPDAYPRYFLDRRPFLSEGEVFFLNYIRSMTEREYLEFLSFPLPRPRAEREGVRDVERTRDQTLKCETEVTNSHVKNLSTPKNKS